MAFQFSVGARNAWLDAIEVYGGTSCSLEIRTGSVPATCATPGAGSVLVTIDLPSGWMADAASGSKAKSGTWEDLTADASGNAGHFRVYSSQATKDHTTCFIQGTITVTAGGGDMTVANITLTINQTVTVTAFTLNAGGA